MTSTSTKGQAIPLPDRTRWRAAITWEDEGRGGEERGRGEGRGGKGKCEDDWERCMHVMGGRAMGCGVRNSATGYE